MWGCRPHLHVLNRVEGSQLDITQWGHLLALLNLPQEMTGDNGAVPHLQPLSAFDSPIGHLSRSLHLDRDHGPR